MTSLHSVRSSFEFSLSPMPQCQNSCSELLHHHFNAPKQQINPTNVHMMERTHLPRRDAKAINQFYLYMKNLSRQEPRPSRSHSPTFEDCQSKEIPGVVVVQLFSTLLCFCLIIHGRQDIWAMAMIRSSSNWIEPEVELANKRHFFEEKYSKSGRITFAGNHFSKLIITEAQMRPWSSTLQRADGSL